ncbi:hypothetical protein D5086_030107 [Populus alba]|uniref:Uncharacterized protein n=1 Tax=Populus alba TaxID=43335 RepID=A0ACC4AND0_POPAL
MNSTMLANVLNALKPAARSRLRHVTLLNGTKHYMGPIFDPSLRGELVHQEPPFKEDLGRLPYPNFYYALEDLVASYLPSITHSVHRSSIIIDSIAFHSHRIPVVYSKDVWSISEDVCARAKKKHNWAFFMEKENSSDASVALIVGITGLAGFSLAEALKKPTTPGRPWKVYGIARRPLPRWFPAFLVDGFISLDALDCADTANKLSPVAHEITHVFWVSMQHHGNEEVNISVNSTMLANVLNALKSTAPSRLRHVTLLTGTKHYMGPIFDPSLRGELVHQEPPFKEDLGRLPYPNFYHALEDLVASYLPSITHSVHRSSIIIGIIFPVLKAEGIKAAFLPETMPTYYRTPPAH